MTTKKITIHEDEYKELRSKYGSIQEAINTLLEDEETAELIKQYKQHDKEATKIRSLDRTEKATLVSSNKINIIDMIKTSLYQQCEKMDFFMIEMLRTEILNELEISESTKYKYLETVRDHYQNVKRSELAYELAKDRESQRKIEQRLKEKGMKEEYFIKKEADTTTAELTRKYKERVKRI